MTVPAHTAPVDVPDLVSALAAVRARGLRLSSARRLVLGALFAAGQSLSAEDVARSAGCDLASVYRNLEALEEVGIVRHQHAGHGPGRYALAGAAPELVACEHCGARATVPRAAADAVRAAVLAVTGFVPRMDHFPLHGLCARCADRIAAAREGASDVRRG
jgi:Fur family ferric uptake transcriptional regulator